MKSVNKWLYFLCFSVVTLFACSGGGGSVEDLLEKPGSTSGEVSPSITLGKSSLSFGASSSSETVTVTSNVEWDFECSESWVTVSKGSASQLNVSVSDNYSSSARNASISLKQQGKSTTLAAISVSQSGAAVSDEISASKTSLSFTADGGSENITVTSNFTWETISKPSWITLSPSRGTNGSTSVVMTADKSTSTSERTGTIKLGKGSTSVSIAVSQAALSSIKYSQTFTVTGNGKTVKFKMIYVQGGTFTMGPTSEQYDNSNEEDEFWSNYGFPHSVTLKDYCIGETEVTQALWYAIMGEEPVSDLPYYLKWWYGFGEGDNYPAYSISYNDCQKFINKLNSITGKNFRLPTEAEWEFAARGGTKSRGYRYAGSNSVDDVAWYIENSYKIDTKCREVATKRANELGIYDMSGSLQEWCSDWFDWSRIRDPQTNPQGPSSGERKVIRNGSWSNGEVMHRLVVRFSGGLDDHSIGLGMRLAHD